MSLLLDARKKIELALEHNGIHKPTDPQLPESTPLGNALTHGTQHSKHDESSHEASQRAAPAGDTPKAGNPLSAKADAELTPPVGAPPLTPARGTPPDARHTGGLGAGSDPVAAPVKGTPVGAPPLRSDPVAAGKNLFAAKAAPIPARRRLGIIPIALVSGLVLASAGGYYVWREISPQPVLQRPPSASRPAPHIAQAVAPAPALEPAPVVPATGTPPAPSASEVAAKKAPAASGPAAAPKPAGHTAQIPSTPPLQKGGAAGGGILSAQPINIERIKESDAVDPTLLAGYKAYSNGDLRTAWQHYSDVLGKDAKNRDALLGLAAIAQQQSQDDVAARYYRQVLVLDPRDPVANAGMSVLFGASNAAGTESRLKGLIAQYPQSSALHFALGSHYAEQSRWGEAQQAFFNACNLEPDNTQFAFNLAVSLDHLGQGKLAAQHYRRALQLDSSGGAGIDRAQTQKRLNELTAP